MNLESRISNFESEFFVQTQLLDHCIQLLLSRRSRLLDLVTHGAQGIQPVLLGVELSNVPLSQRGLLGRSPLAATRGKISFEDPRNFQDS
jgi:hypothetical protein